MAIGSRTDELTTERRTLSQTLEQQSVLLIDDRRELVERLEVLLQAAKMDVFDCESLNDSAAVTRRIHATEPLTIVLSPLMHLNGNEVANVERAKAVIDECAQLASCRLVLVSSAEVYGADYANPGLMRENRTAKLRTPNRAAENWAELEIYATERFQPGTHQLIVLRPCWTLFRNGCDGASRLFRSRMSFVSAGFDPSIQILDVDDLATAIVAAVESDEQGIFNIAPDSAIPLQKALRLVQSWRLPIPHFVKVACHSIFRRTKDSLADFLRSCWTTTGAPS